MTDQAQSTVPAEHPARTSGTLASTATLAVLVVLGDLLFFRHDPGVGLAIFCVALIGGVMALNRQGLRNKQVLLLAVVAGLGVLPLVESANLLWWPGAMGGVALLALATSGNLRRYEDWLGVVVRFAVLAPVRLMTDVLDVIGSAGRLKSGRRFGRLLLVWLVPVLCAAVFAGLFVAANPILEIGLSAIRLDVLLRLFDPARVFLWGFLAAICWPLLAPRLLRWSAPAEMQGPLPPRSESVVFGGEAIRNSLLVFNALFAIQTAMDMLFLWGGVKLPEGMTHADYAHRGAYPLIVTAVLAGAFVLAAMRKGGAGENSSLIRRLVYLWIAQNVWLVVSSMLRLDLYVEAYSLTELRLAAGIWMGLVAVGLVLILAKIVLSKSNRWLIMANATALAVTLYGVAWLDFPAVISRFNAEHSYEVTGEGQSLDLYYVDTLGPAAIPALDQFLLTAKHASADTLKTFSIERDNLLERVRRPADWQSWTWRDDRLLGYLAAHPYAPEPGRAIN